MKASLLAFICWKWLASDSWEDIQSGLYLSQVVLTLEAEKFIWNLILGSQHVQNMPSDVTGQCQQEGASGGGCQGRPSVLLPGWKGCPVLGGLFWGAFAQCCFRQNITRMSRLCCHCHVLLFTCCTGQLVWLNFCAAEEHWNILMLQLKQIKSMYLYMGGWSHCEAYFRVFWVLVDFHMRTWAGRRKISLSRRRSSAERGEFHTVIAWGGFEKVLDIKSMFFKQLTFQCQWGDVPA